MKIRFQYDLFFGILFAVFLLQDALATKLSLFQSFDEFFLVVVGITLAIYVISNQVRLNYHIRKVVYIYIGFLIVGLMGNIYSSYQTIPGVILDVFNFSKFFLCFLTSFIMCKGKRNKKYESTVVVTINVLTVILFFMVIHDSFFTPFYPYLDDRYGTRSLRLFFSNQTYLAVTGVLLVVFQYCFAKESIRKYIFILMSTLITVSTFRSKAIGFCGIALLIIFYFSKKKSLNISKIVRIGFVLAGVAVFLGWDYLEYYLLSPNKYSMRYLILTNGIELAQKFFPIGTGFGTYCSLGSRVGYSMAYDYLGMKSLYMNPVIYDMFWAALVGQFGFLGTVLYIIFIVNLLLFIIKYRKVNELFWASVLMCAYLVIASLGESSFNTYYACIMGIFVGYAAKVNFIQDIE